MTEPQLPSNAVTGTDSGTPALRYHAIDHIALAVMDLEPAIALFSDVLGFRLVRRLHIQGAKTGMRSAEMEANGVKFVLCQGTEPESPLSRMVTDYGPGVAHVGILVDDVDATVSELKARGMKFDTGVIEGPGLTQAFTARDGNSGLTLEVLKRNGEEGFVEANVQSLFDQLEQSQSV
jgi:4-hydroxyphenylpyruvate dioxygenase-like putative hemolysin